jgi:hypothetical protein
LFQGTIPLEQARLGGFLTLGRTNGSLYAFWNLFLNRLSEELPFGLFIGPRVLKAFATRHVCISHH